MSTHNIGFYEDLTKIIFELSSNFIKYSPYFFCCQQLCCQIMAWTGFSHHLYYVLYIHYQSNFTTCSSTGHSSSVRSVSASQAAIPRSSHPGHNLPLPLIQEELVFSYWQKNGH